MRVKYTFYCANLFATKPAVSGMMIPKTPLSVSCDHTQGTIAGWNHCLTVVEWTHPRRRASTCSDC